MCMFKRMHIPSLGPFISSFVLLLMISVSKNFDLLSARMGEERSPKSINAPADLSGNLRGDVINCIVEHLPLCDAAKMCVLSHKWQDAWISTPQLIFDAQFCSSVLERKRYSSNLDKTLYCTVSRILFLHDGPIHKFSLYVPSILRKYLDVTEWVSFLSRIGIRDFSLQNHFQLYLKLSKHLFSCLDLESLNLLRCVLSPPPNFMGFRKLKNLELVQVIIKEGTFEQFIAVCPLLERICLKHCKGFERVNVDAPNLKQLTVLSATLKELYVGNAENLMSASIALGQLTTSSRALIEVFAKSTKLEKLWFGGRFCKVLFNDGLVHPIFDSIRILELSSLHLDDANGFSSAVRAIQSCPNIEKLYISVTRIADVYNLSLAYDLSCQFLQLRNITATLESGWDVELKLMEFLLACSPKLEMMSLEINFELDSCEKSRIATTLSQFHKASPNMTLVICMSGRKDDSSFIDLATDPSSDPEPDTQPHNIIYPDPEPDTPHYVIY